MAQMQQPQQPPKQPKKRGLSIGDGFNFGIGFWSAGFLFYIVMTIILVGLLVVLPAIGCGLLSSLAPGNF